MTEFGTTAVLDVEVDERSLRNARQQIQSGIGATPAGVTDGGTPSAQAANSGRERRRRRREFRWARERTGHLEDLVEIADGIEDGLGEGGLGGGMLSELAGGVGGVLPQAIATGVGSAVGTAVGDAIAGETLEIDTEGADDIGVDTPADPLAVDHPEEPYALDHPAEAYALDHPEGPYDVDHPEEPYALDHPGEPYAVDHPEGPYDLDHPEEPYAVEDPSPLEVEKPSPLEVEEPGPVEITVDVSGQGGGTSIEPWRPDNDPGSETVFEALEPRRERTREQTENIPVIGERVADADRWAEEQLSGLQDRLFGGGDRSDPPARRSRAPSGGGGVSVDVTSPQDITVNLGDVAVEADVDSLRDEIMDDVEDMVDDAIDDLERKIQRA